MFAVAETTAISCAVIPAAALLPHFDIYGHSVPLVLLTEGVSEYVRSSDRVSDGERALLVQ